MARICTHRFLPVLFLLVSIGSGWPGKLLGQTINQFDWVKPLPGEPVGTAIDTRRNTYVVTAGNTLIEFDTGGRERWRQTFPTWPQITQLATDPAGSLLLTGTFTGSAVVGDSSFRLIDSFIPNTFLAKLDSTHRLVWTRQVPGPDYLDYPVGLKTDSLGYIYVLGARVSGPVLIEVDPFGQHFNKQTLFSLVQPAPLPTSLDADANGNVVATLTQVGKIASFGIAQKISGGVTAWSHYVDEGLPPVLGTYNTNALQVSVDKYRNSYILSNYALPDPSNGKVLETGQALLKLDASGARVWQKSGPTVADSAQAQGVFVDPAGVAITYGGYSGKIIAGSFPVRYTTDDYIGLTLYAPNGDQRWTTRFGSAQGNDKLYRVERDANGALLMAASTTGPLTLGTINLTGTADAPAYYLAKLQPAQLRPDSSLSLLCIGSSIKLQGRFTGYFDEDLTVELSDASGSFAKPILVGIIPVNSTGSYYPGPITSPSLSLPATLPAGNGYRLRVASAVPVYVSESLPVRVSPSPAPPLIRQIGDELVSNATIGNQWFTADKKPITGATAARYTPTKAGQYYAVSTVNGCPSPPSELLTYLITAVEPIASTAAMTIYPNPATDRIRVEWTGVAPGVLAEVVLYDMVGKQCRQVSRTEGATDLWLNGLSSGNYIVSVQVDGKPINSRRLIVR